MTAQAAQVGSAAPMITPARPAAPLTVAERLKADARRYDAQARAIEFGYGITAHCFRVYRPGHTQPCGVAVVRKVAR